MASIAYVPAMYHGPIRRVPLPGSRIGGNALEVFIVEGRFSMWKGLLKPHRNMTILQNTGTNELMLINTVRLDPAGMEELGKLGRVAHIVTLSGAHGRDDPWFYAQFPEAKRWAPPGYTGRCAGWDKLGEPVVHARLGGEPLPFPGLEPYTYEDMARQPDPDKRDMALMLKRPVGGNVLLACDLVMNYKAHGEGERTGARPMNFHTRLIMSAVGFKGRMIMPKDSVEHFAPDKKPAFFKASMEKLCGQEWSHLVSGHGCVALNTAREDLIKTMKSQFGEGFTPRA